MAKQRAKSKAPAPPTPYEMIGARIQKIMNSHAAQKDRSVSIGREQHGASENDNVALEHRTVGSVLLSWTVPAED